jgi:hypothetical protein
MYLYCYEILNGLKQHFDLIQKFNFYIITVLHLHIFFLFQYIHKNICIKHMYQVEELLPSTENVILYKEQELT